MKVPASATTSEAVLRFTPGVALLHLASRPVLFSPLAEAVFELHGAAVLVAKLLAEGTTASALVDLVIASGWSAKDARSLLLELLVDWSRRSLLSMDELETARTLGTYEIATRPFEILSALGAPNLQPSEIFRHREADNDRPLSRYILAPILGAFAIRSPSGEVVIAASDEVVPELKSAVIGELLRSSENIALHAACLIGGDGAILLIGAPGSGKTTLAAGLGRHGFSYAGDDITLLENGMARGVCVALTLKEGSPILKSDEPLVHRRRDGVQLTYSWPKQIAQEAAYPITALIRLNRGSHEPCLDDCDPLALMRDVLGEAFSASGSASLSELKMIDRIFGSAASLELRYSRLEDAIQLLSDKFL